MLDNIIDYNMIGSRIKKRRNELNMTQEQLANELNLSVFYISKIENGKASATLETLAFIAQKLGIDLVSLLTGTSKLEKTYYFGELDTICKKATTRQLNLIAEIAKTILKN